MEDDTKEDREGDDDHVDPGDDDEEVEEDEEDLEEELDDYDEDEDKEDDRRYRRREQRRERNPFLMDAAEEEEEDEDNLSRQRQQMEQDDAAYMVPRLEERREKRRRFEEKSAEEIAKELAERHRNMRQLQHQTARQGMSISTYRALHHRPTINDPKLFSIRCKPGEERQLVVRLLGRYFSPIANAPPPKVNPTTSTLSATSEGGVIWNFKGGSVAQASLTDIGPMKILSAFTTGTRGIIYVEAFREEDVKNAIRGMNGVYQTRMSIVPVDQMPDVLGHVELRRGSVTLGSFVRLQRFPYKGDLAKVFFVSDAGNRVTVLAVPRIDYKELARRVDTTNKTNNNNNNKKKKAVRPPARLFRPEEAAQEGARPSRNRYQVTNTEQNELNGMFFNDNGFVFLDVSVRQLTVDNVEPTLDEHKVFLGLDSKVPMTEVQLNQAVAAKLRENDTSRRVEDLFRGDTVVVIAGEQSGMRGVVQAVDVFRKTCQVMPSDPEQRELLGSNVELRFSDVVKHFDIGTHVIVAYGTHAGQTGNVIIVADGSPPIAKVLTDIGHHEIEVFVTQLRESAEVDAGLDRLGGYRLNDLVQLNQNKLGVVVHVGTKSLKVLVEDGKTVDVEASAIRSKRNDVSRSSSAYDKYKNLITLGDPIIVEDGPRKGMEGVVKHFARVILFVHSRNYLQNAGLFAVPSRDVKLTTVKAITGTSSGANLVRAQMMPHAAVSAAAGGAGGAVQRKDNLIGKTVRITRGFSKGLSGVVVDVRDDKAVVELHARYKKEIVKKEDLVQVNNESMIAPPMSSDSFRMPTTTMATTINAPKSPTVAVAQADVVSSSSQQQRDDALISKEFRSRDRVSILSGPHAGESATIVMRAGKDYVVKLSTGRGNRVVAASNLESEST